MMGKLDQNVQFLLLYEKCFLQCFSLLTSMERFLKSGGRRDVIICRSGY